LKKSSRIGANSSLVFSSSWWKKRTFSATLGSGEGKSALSSPLLRVKQKSDNWRGGETEEELLIGVSC
jgi:hypothetical protein